MNSSFDSINLYNGRSIIIVVQKVTELKFWPCLFVTIIKSAYPIVQVNNTDAEGRLTLADALVYTCNQGVDKVCSHPSTTF